MDVILATPDLGEGLRHAQEMLVGLDEESLRRVAAFLAERALLWLSKGRGPGTAPRLLERMRMEAVALLPAVTR
jgi:hypothetical protein